MSLDVSYGYGLTPQMIAFVESSFKGARLREKQNAKMRFEIPQQEDKTLGAMFGFIEVETRVDDEHFLAISISHQLQPKSKAQAAKSKV